MNLILAQIPNEVVETAWKSAPALAALVIVTGGFLWVSWKMVTNFLETIRVMAKEGQETLNDINERHEEQIERYDKQLATIAQDVAAKAEGTMQIVQKISGEAHSSARASHEKTAEKFEKVAVELSTLNANLSAQFRQQNKE